LVLIKAAQGFSVRRTHVRRSRKPAENADQDQKDLFWPDTRSHFKNWIFARDQGEAEDQPAGIHKYVEDLRRGRNADIGRKDFFAIAS